MLRSATSIIRPKYITTTRAEMRRTTARSWAMKKRRVGICAAILQQIDDLPLDLNVERRYRLVADDEGRLHRQRTRDTDALALAAGKLMRITLGHIPPQPDISPAVRLRARASTSAAAVRSCKRAVARQ